MVPAETCATPEPPDLSALGTHWPGATFHLDADFRWTWLGESVETLTGRSARAWLADPAAWESAVHPLDRTRHAAHWRSLEHQPRGASLRFRLLHAKSGAVIWLHEFCVPVFDAGDELRGFAGLWMEDTRAARLEKRLAAGAWAETLGAMTAGLVHDFNNVLTGVISLSEHFLTQIPPGHPFHEGLTLLQGNGREASRWIHLFGQLHQTRPGTATWHNVNDLVADTAQILRHALSRRFELTVHPSPEPVPVMVEAGGFERALLMLVFRVAARMTQPGPLRLQVTHVPAKDGARSSWVRVGVEIFSELMPPVGDAAGEAVLNAVKQFAARLGGKLEVDQRVAAGTATWLWLPAATAELSVMEPSAPRSRWLLLGGGSPAQMAAWADWLRERSFLVTVLGPDEIEFHDGDDYPFDAAIVLVDVAGPAAASKFLERLHAAHPELPAVTVLPEGIGFELETHFSQVTAVVAAGEEQRERLVGKLTAALEPR